MTRWTGEAVFLSDWRYKLMGNRYPVHPAYLEPCGWAPNPQLPLITAIHLIKAAIEDDAGHGFILNHPLPHGVSYKDIGSRCASTVQKINWLDPLR